MCICIVLKREEPDFLPDTGLKGTLNDIYDLGLGIHKLLENFSVNQKTEEYVFDLNLRKLINFVYAFLLRCCCAKHTHKEFILK